MKRYRARYGVWSGATEWIECDAAFVGAADGVLHIVVDDTRGAGIDRVILVPLHFIRGPIEIERVG